MVSLYVCDFPQNLESEDLKSIFQEFDGFIEARVARDKTGQRIAFVDYADQETAKFAQSSCQGYRFVGANRGLNVRISDNNRRCYQRNAIDSTPARNGQQNQNRVSSGTYSPQTAQLPARQNDGPPRSILKKQSTADGSAGLSQLTSSNRPQVMFKNELGQTGELQQSFNHGDTRTENLQQSAGGMPINLMESLGAMVDGGAGGNPDLNSAAIESLLEQLKDSPDSGIQQQVQTIQSLLKSLQQNEQSGSPESLAQSTPILSSSTLPNVFAQSSSVNKDYPVVQQPVTVTKSAVANGNDQLMANHVPSMLYKKEFEAGQGSGLVNHQPDQLQIVKPIFGGSAQSNPEHEIQSQKFVAGRASTTSPMIEDLASNQNLVVLQSLVNQLQPNNLVNTLRNAAVLTQSLGVVPQQHQPQVSTQVERKLTLLQQAGPTFESIANKFDNVMHYPKNVTKTVYVEGIPADATEREMAHIFRPFPGFKQLRLVPRETKDGQKVHFCFADFDTTEQTTIVVNTLQGYRFHKADIIGLQFSYAVAGGQRFKN